MMNHPKPYHYVFSCLIIIATLAPVQLSYAQNSPQDYLDAHNAARDVVGVGWIEWDDEVAAYALEYASSRINDCALVHSNGPYGENIAWGSNLEGIDAVKLWVDEEIYYDLASNTCSAPAGESCLHYTQVIWRNSVRLGCARVQCDSGSYYVVCSYDPPGNVMGETPY